MPRDDEFTRAGTEPGHEPLSLGDSPAPKKKTSRKSKSNDAELAQGLVSALGDARKSGSGVKLLEAIRAVIKG